MSSPFELAGLSWRDLGRRVAKNSAEDEITGRAAQLAYYFFAALFPALLFLTAILGLVAGPDSALGQEAIRSLTSAMPASASGLVRQVITQTSAASGGGKLTFGLLLTLLSASAGMLAVFGALNCAYRLKESRGFIHQRALALGLTIVVALLVVAASALIIYGEAIIDVAGNYIGLGGPAVIAGKIMQWPIAIACLLLSLDLVYHFGPDRPRNKWRWITPGAVMALLLWLLVSCGLRVYLHFFNSYSATYGSLGAVMILLLWFYVSGLAVLLGGEVNSAIETARAGQGKSAVAGKN